ncbi:MAG TPA: CcmD family protein [Bryobacteraceae bacterium]|nr:CcmD family protein [Bryobacteraceae bacterium]
MERNFLYLCYGLIAAWLIIFIYVVSLALRERSLRQELDRVKKLVEDSEHEARR